MLEKLGFNCAGLFFVVADVSGEKNPRRERVNFSPSAETPTIADYISKKFEEVKLWGRVERLEIRRDGGSGIACTFSACQAENQD